MSEAEESERDTLSHQMMWIFFIKAIHAYVSVGMSICGVVFGRFSLFDLVFHRIDSAQR